MEGMQATDRLLPGGEHGSHHLVDQVDRLQRPEHHLEVRDLAATGRRRELAALDQEAVIQRL